MSDLLRKEAANTASAWAEEIQSKLPKGELVSSGACMAALRSFLDSWAHEASQIILLDGFPRNMDQALQYQRQVCSPTKLVLQLIGLDGE